MASKDMQDYNVCNESQSCNFIHMNANLHNSVGNFE